ncbi:hypothetical protein ScalyP_jg846, partial [Parmales sp. scaly parma]
MGKVWFEFGVTEVAIYFATLTWRIIFHLILVEKVKNYNLQFSRFIARTMIRLILILSLLTMILVSAWYLGGFSRLDYEVAPSPDFALDDEDEDLNSLKKKSDKQSKSPKGKAKESGGRSNSGKSKKKSSKKKSSTKKSSTKKGSSSTSSAAPSGAPSEAPSAAPSDAPSAFPTATPTVG